MKMQRQVEPYSDTRCPMQIGRNTYFHYLCERLIHKPCSSGYPYYHHCNERPCKPHSQSLHQNQSVIPSLFGKFCLFGTVCASSSTNTSKDIRSTSGHNVIENSTSVENEAEGESKTQSVHQYSPELERIARAYIEKETGMQRLALMLKKDHKGNNSPEVEYIMVALWQTFFVTFFIKYIPTWKRAREEFIQRNRGTVFKTRLEALRRMQDQISYRAILAGCTFASKLTCFSAGFLLLSQSISCYRNKTSFVEYATAAGLLGGLARIQLGLKGVLVGSVLGAVLGSMVGGVGYFLLNGLELSQEQRHLHAIMAKLEVERYLVGDKAFQGTVQEIRKTIEASPSAA